MTKTKPPKFTEKQNYKNWKTLVERWIKITDEPKDDMATVLILHIENSKAMNEVVKRSATINSVEQLLEVLDNVFRREVDPIGDLFLKYKEFDTIERREGETIREYIDRFTYLQEELEQSYKLLIPQPILCFKLMEGANIPEHTKQMIGTDVKVATVDEITARLNRAFNFLSAPQGHNIAPNINIKAERHDPVDTFYVKKNIACYICADPEHLQYDCPHNECRYEYSHEEQRYRRVSKDREVRPRPDETTNRSLNLRNDRYDNGNQNNNGINQRNNNRRAGAYQRGYNNDRRYNNGNNRRNNYRNYSSRGDYTQRRNEGYTQNSYYTEDRQNNRRNGDYTQDYQNDRRRSDDLGPTVYFGTETTEMNNLLDECLNHALLDSGAGKTVCGESWLKVYEDALQSQSEELTAESIRFRFGDGEPIESVKRVLIPAEIGGSSVLLDAYVVPSNIPLLLSRESMKRAGMSIDFKHDVVKVGDQPQPTAVCSTGQYLIPILPNKAVGNLQSMFHVSTVSQQVKDRAEKLHKVLAHATAERIYKLACKANGPDLDLKKKLIEVVDNCEVCQKMRRPPPRPKVCLPLSSRFNEVVAMDIKYINSTPVLHLIDTFTRFSMGCVMTSKSAPAIIEAIFAIWITIFGRPQKFFSDNGLEFANKEFLSLCEQYEIKAKVSPVEAPYSNGICERHNGIIDEMCRKTLQKTRCSLKTALMWSINAKNSLLNIYGFSPQQLVLGNNCSLPTIFEQKDVPCFNEETISKMVADNILAMRTSREEFMKVESDKRIKRALKSRVYQYNNEAVVPGDEVYYKRLKNKDYHGPATVVGEVDNTVIIRHGGQLMRLHASKLRLKKKVDALIDNRMEETAEDQCKKAVQSKCDGSDSYYSDSSSEEGNGENPDSTQEVSFLSADEDIPQLEEQNTAILNLTPVEEQDPFDLKEEQQTNTEITEQEQQHQWDDNQQERLDSEEEIVVINEEEIEVITVNPNEEHTIEDEHSHEELRRVIERTVNISTPSIPRTNLAQHRPFALNLSNINQNDSLMTPLRSTEMAMSDKLKSIFPQLKKGDTIKVKEMGKDWVYVQLTSKGGKKKGANKFHWNVVDDNFQEYGIHFDRLENFRVTNRTPDNVERQLEIHATLFVEALNKEVREEHIFLEVSSDRYDELHIREAMHLEVEKWRANEVYAEVEDKGQPRISSRWVIIEKVERNDNKIRIAKARLTPRGYEELLKYENRDETSMPTNSPTIEKRSIRAMLNVVVSKSWKLHSLDIKSAFLNSDAIDRVLYMKPPKEVRNGKKLWLIKKPVYGLKDASRKWYQKLTKELVENLGCVQSKLDKALFTWINYRSNLAGIMVVHVDDIQYGGTQEYIDAVIEELKKKFEVSKEGVESFKYVGMTIKQENNKIRLDQNDYLDSVQLPLFERRKRDKDEQLSEQESTDYRKLVGQMMWVVIQSRPDAIFPILYCSTRNQHPTVQDMMNIMRVSTNIKESKIELVIQHLGDIRTGRVVMYCYVDGRYGVIGNKVHSVGAHVILLASGERCSVLSWQCCKIKHVVTSAMEAETEALMAGLKESMYLRELLSEMLTGSGDSDELKLYIGAYSDSQSLVRTVQSETQSPDLQLRKRIGWIRETVRGENVYLTWVRSKLQMADALTREESAARGLLLKALSGELPPLDPAFRGLMSMSRREELNM